MSDATLSAQRGTTIGFLLPVVLGGTPFDVTADDTTVVVTFKRRRSDAAALVSKTFDADGSGDLQVLVGSTSEIVVQLEPEDTTPRVDGSFTSTEFLVWDAILTEASGRETAIAKGALTVRAGVGS